MIVESGLDRYETSFLDGGGTLCMRVHASRAGARGAGEGEKTKKRPKQATILSTGQERCYPEILRPRVRVNMAEPRTIFIPKPRSGATDKII